MTNSNVTLLNLTPHVLRIQKPDLLITELPKDGDPPRLSVERVPLGKINSLPIVRSTMGTPVGLPEEKEGVILIVAALVAEHPSLVGRTDLAYPGAPIRGGGGQVIGAAGLCAGPGLAKKLAARPT